MINQVFLVGRLGTDVEIRYTKNSKAVASFSMATGRTWTDGNGDKQEKTEWHSVKVWGKQAETCQRYLKKGRQCAVIGELETESWETKDGEKRYKTIIRAGRVQFLGGNDSFQKPEETESPMLQEPSFTDDDIPF